jgi:hypothetical protein
MDSAIERETETKVTVLLVIDQIEFVKILAGDTTSLKVSTTSPVSRRASQLKLEECTLKDSKLFTNKYRPEQVGNHLFMMIQGDQMVHVFEKHTREGEMLETVFSRDEMVVLAHDEFIYKRKKI